VRNPAGVEAIPEEQVLVVGVAEVSQETTCSLELVQDVLEGQLREGGGPRVFHRESEDAEAVARAPSHLRDRQ
jgi:hypothetical protein